MNFLLTIMEGQGCKCVDGGRGQGYRRSDLLSWLNLVLQRRGIRRDARKRRTIRRRGMDGLQLWRQPVKKLFSNGTASAPPVSFLFTMTPSGQVRIAPGEHLHHLPSADQDRIPSRHPDQTIVQPQISLETQSQPGLLPALSCSLHRGIVSGNAALPVWGPVGTGLHGGYGWLQLQYERWEVVGDAGAVVDAGVGLRRRMQTWQL